jgi:hypothetical protein
VKKAFVSLCCRQMYQSKTSPNFDVKMIITRTNVGIKPRRVAKDFNEVATV